MVKVVERVLQRQHYEIDKCMLIFKSYFILTAHSPKTNNPHKDDPIWHSLLSQDD